MDTPIGQPQGNKLVVVGQARNLATALGVSQEELNKGLAVAGQYVKSEYGVQQINWRDQAPKITINRKNPGLDVVFEGTTAGGQKFSITFHKGTDQDEPTLIADVDVMTPKEKALEGKGQADNRPEARIDFNMGGDFHLEDGEFALIPNPEGVSGQSRPKQLPEGAFIMPL